MKYWLSLLLACIPVVGYAQTGSIQKTQGSPEEYPKYKPLYLESSGPWRRMRFSVVTEKPEQRFWLAPEQQNSLPPLMEFTSQTYRLRAEVTLYQESGKELTFGYSRKVKGVGFLWHVTY